MRIGGWFDAPVSTVTRPLTTLPKSRTMAGLLSATRSMTVAGPPAASSPSG
jgi:hypothetical protein